MKCTIYYRTYGGENAAPRPPWYSKDLCLRSLINAVNHLHSVVEPDLVVLHDGPLCDNISWADRIDRLLSGRGRIREFPRTNNAQSFMSAVTLAQELASDQILVFAEDDYLWRPESLSKMVSALNITPADYVTGYDHPVRYQPDYPKGADLPHWDTYIYFAADHHWRTQESTCMTFATRVDTLREDIDIFWEHHNNGKNYPDDRILFRHLQALGDLRPTNRRLLLGPIPSLNTHAHLPWLAPGVNWDSIAKEVGTM
jgi:hypothetical protein